MKKIYLFLIMAIVAFSIGCAHIKNNNTKQTEKNLAFIDYKAGYVFGNQKAKIVLVEYSSYECKDCRDLEKNIGKVLKKNVDNGNLLYIYKPVDHPKFENDEKINRYFAPNTLEDLEDIFSKFDSYSKKPYEVAQKVLNLTEKEVPNYETMSKQISEEITAGNITGTPTMYINGDKYENIFTEQEFQKILDLYSKEK